MKLLICSTVLLLLLSGCGSKAEPPRDQAAAPAGPAAAQVDSTTQRQLGIEVIPVQAKPMAAPVSSPGQLVLNEDRTWRVGAVTEGRIVTMLVHLGDRVTAFQTLAQMHSHDVHDSRAAWKEAGAELERAKVVSAQAKRVRDRTRRLFDLKAAAKEQLEAAETQYESAEISVSNAQTEVLKAEHHLTEFLNVPLQESADDGPTGDAVPINSPAAGTVMERLVSIGAVVSAGDPVVTVSDLSSLWLIAAVNEADLSLIHVGQHVAVSVRAYPDRTFTGTVFQLGERLDPQTRTLQVRVLVRNPQSLLKPDMFATANFTPRESRPSLHVPEAAIQEWHGRTVVFVRTPSGSFEPKDVKVGARANREVEILSGIEPGTPVVVNGALLLKSQLAPAED